MAFEYIKALHIIFVVTWFAGLFYIVRLFIYQTEAMDRPEAERAILKPQLDLMARRLWTIITWPSAVLTLVFGIWVLLYRPAYLQLPFMHAKLGFVILLYAYHIRCHYIYKALQQGIAKWSSAKLRMWNEVATLLLFAIVFLIVLKNLLNMVWGMLGLVMLAMALMLATKWYKSIRERN
ncbi:putative membrane protein [Cyclobacterium lianum]|uniref:Protoporphyrinogen IX oxidase n=1 Tax=Cyclobacterium lianum TaxID=388280 RepID=A0A1M7PDT4_9BACT|nr:CopD family protein [Cyclobacterium lianum]SHN15131.1 putative membrane protein [Cyclobacterium lianum]